MKQRGNCMKCHMALCLERPQASVGTKLCFAGLLGCNTMCICFRGLKIETAVIYLQVHMVLQHKTNNDIFTAVRTSNLIHTINSFL
jgi:hypothetical protein